MFRTLQRVISASDSPFFSRFNQRNVPAVPALFRYSVIKVHAVPADGCYFWSMPVISLWRERCWGPKITVFTGGNFYVQTSFSPFFLGQIRDLQSSSGLVAGSPGPAVPCFPLPFAGSCMYGYPLVAHCPVAYVLRGKGQGQIRYILLGGEESLTWARAACGQRRPTRRSFLILLETSLLREASLSTRPLIPLTSVPQETHPSYPPNVGDTHFSRNVIQRAGNSLLSFYIVPRSVRLMVGM